MSEVARRVSRRLPKYRPSLRIVERRNPRFTDEPLPVNSFMHTPERASSSFHVSPALRHSAATQRRTSGGIVSLLDRSFDLAATSTARRPTSLSRLTA